MVEKYKFVRLKPNGELNTLLPREENGGMFTESNTSLPTPKRNNLMNKKVGLWLDRKKAVLVSLKDNIEEKKIIISDMENYALYSNIVPGDGSPENIRDRRFWNQLDRYYDKIIAEIRDAAEIQIFGPAEAKYELQKHLEREGLAEAIVSVEEADKLTYQQIAVKVQKRFPARSRFDLS